MLINTILIQLSTTQDRVLTDAMAFLLRHKETRDKWLEISHESSNKDGPNKLLDLSFVPDKWWSFVTGKKDRGVSVSRVDRRYFELCLLTNIMFELKSGDLCIPGSDQFSDYRTELISEEQYKPGVALYEEQAGIPVDGPSFIARLRAELEAAAKLADEGFPDNEHLQIENAIPLSVDHRHSRSKLRSRRGPIGPGAGVGVRLRSQNKFSLC
jgi:hypothetical protein